MRFAIHGIVPTIALFCYILLFVVALRQGLRYRIVSSFAFYLLSMGIWSFTALMIYLDPARIALWGRAMLIAGSVMMPLALYMFSRTFAGSNPFDRWLYTGLLFGAMLVGLILEGYVQQFESLTSKGEIVYRFGPALPLAALFWIALIGLSAYSLVKAYLTTPDSVTRNRIRLALFGLAFVLTGTLTNGIPRLGAYPFDIAGNLLNALLITYAILRYKFLDVAFDTRRGLVLSLIVVGVATTYILTFFAAQHFPSLGVYILLLSFVLLIAVTSFVYPTIGNALVTSVDRLFFREKYRAREEIQRLSRDLTATLDMEEIARILLDGVTQALSLDRAVLLIRTSQGYRLLDKETGDFESAPVLFTLDHPLVKLLSNQGSVSLRDFQNSGAYRALWAEERKQLEDLGVELFLGLRAKGELAGILGLGDRPAKQPYSEEDKVVLATLVNQAATAMENARLYRDLQRQYEELKRAQAQLIQSEKLAAVGELISGVAHELNNPLTSILGFADLLRKSDVDPRVREDLEIIYTQAQRSARIVRSLLTFARQYKAEKVPIDLNDAIIAALDLLTYQLKVDNIHVTLDLAPNLPMVEADVHQMQQVFLNIITNAQQAIRGAHSQGNILIQSQALPGAVLAVVSDDGPGIPEEIQDKIFDPFFTTKEVGKGTGLGLSICYGIIQEHGGRIWVESEYGKGATFYVELPACEEEAVEIEAPPTTSTEEERIPVDTARILVVDDEESLTSLLTTILRQHGHYVEAFRDGAEALRAIARAEGMGRGYDVILADVKMPGMNGIELYHELRRLSNAVAERVIFCTGDTISPSTREFLQGTNNRVLSKPFRIEELVRLVGEMLTDEAVEEQA